jgi:N12 class adenine-specific DNA methylase
MSSYTSNINGNLYGIELDDVSGRIAKKLFPSAKIEINGFEKTKLENNFDLIIGNIPFGSYQIYDSQYDEKYLIHDYFFIKSIDKLKAGGILAFITSKGTLDKSSNTVRKYLAQRAELLGAIRLPNTTFKNIANTEVTTDIIFLQKRNRPIVCEPDWIHIGANSDGVPMNQYFIENPEMLLGKMIFNKSMYGNSKDTALVQSKDFNLEKYLDDAISKIRAFDIELKESKILESKNNDIIADPTVKNFSYTIVDSELYYRKNDFMYKSPLKGKKLEKAKQLHFIRNKIREVINIQLIDDYDIRLLKEKQKELNDVYDNFVDSYGFINDNANKYIFKDDDDVFLLRNLEVIVNDGYEKSDIFSKETVIPKQSYKIEFAQDALVLSLNNHGKVDLEYMCEVYSKDKNTIIDELDGMIFLNPVTSEYETRDMYLSGNVKEKLNIAKNSGDGYEKNVKELELVQPEPIKIDKIGFRLGTNWINVDIYNEFIYELLETPNYYKVGENNIMLTYNEFDATYSISEKSLHNNLLVNSKYGTERINAYRIIEDSLNQKIVEVNDYIKVEGRKTPKPILNLKETQFARAKQEIIKSEFKSWILRKKSKDIENFYNENLNVYVPRRFLGEIILPAMNPEIELRSHQKEVAMRILLGNSNCLVAHEVGAGKTFSMATGAMLLRRAGVAKKPLFVVPNHLLNQWGSEFITLFPTANILIPSEKDFQTSNRKQFITKIAFGDYDAVFLTFSQFEKIQMSSEFLEKQIRNDIDEIVDAINDIKYEENKSLSVKNYENLKKSLEAKLKEQVEKSKKGKDKILNFDELGVDYLFVDEAHEYKNCFIHTKMRNVGGVSTSNAQKSYDMLMKVRYINDKNNGRGIVFATGTPVTNSISELFVMQRYLQYDDLKKIGIRHFDQWAGCFGDITTTSEIDVTGAKYITKTRFSKFYNMPELLKLLNQVVDFKTADELNIARPNFFKGKPETISVKVSEFAKYKMKEFENRADRIRSGNIDRSLDNMLKITTEGRALAIDPRLIDRSYNNKDSKVYACVNNVVGIYKEYENDKALQLVFLDYGIDLYDNMKNEMIKLGINSNEIVLIGDANTKEKKEIMFSKCRRGEIRVLIGSTEKMGTGTNVQNRMIALHHLDCPWKPSELEQRNGRIRRQGNMYNEVKVYQYITEGTFDAYMWQVQEKKQTFISQLMKNDLFTREYEDIDDRALEYSEVKALCLGDPRLKEKADIDNAIQRLQIEKSEYFKEQNRLKDLVIELPNKVKNIENSINNLRKDMINFNDKSEFHLKQEFNDENKSESQMLFDAVSNIPTNSNIEIGKYDKFCVIVERSFLSVVSARLNSKYNIEISLGESPVGNLKKIKNLKKKYIDELDYLVNRKKELETNLKHAKENTDMPFDKEDELVNKLERQVELTFELEMKRFIVKIPKIIKIKSCNIFTIV